MSTRLEGDGRRYIIYNDNNNKSSLLLVLLLITMGTYDMMNERTFFIIIYYFDDTKRISDIIIRYDDGLQVAGRKGPMLYCYIAALLVY